MKLIIEISEYPEHGAPFTVGSIIKMPNVMKFLKDGYVGHNDFSVRYYRNKREMLDRFEVLSRRIEDCVKEFYKDIQLPLNSATTENNDINLSSSSGNSESSSVEPSER